MIKRNSTVSFNHFTPSRVEQELGSNNLSRVQLKEKREESVRVCSWSKRTPWKTKVFSCVTEQDRHFTHHPVSSYTCSDIQQLRCQRISCVYVHVNTDLTSLSLFSYLLAFLPWLFLLSFFRSAWALSRDSCFIFCSIWNLLNVAWIRGMNHVNLGTPSYESSSVSAKRPIYFPTYTKQ